MAYCFRSFLVHILFHKIKPLPELPGASFPPRISLQRFALPVEAQPPRFVVDGLEPRVKIQRDTLREFALLIVSV